MKFLNIKYAIPSVLLALVLACDREPDKPDLSEGVLILNNWIWNVMNEVYLWEDQIPDLDPEYQEDPQAYFNDLLYVGDKYSWISDDYEAILASFAGVELSTGMSVRPYLLDEVRVISIVEYVTPGSPAADSGIARGEIIVSIDGQLLTQDNYFSLVRQTTATFGFGNFTGSDVIPNGREVTLTAVELNQNPVVYSEVIDYQGQKIGYMVYTQFTFGLNEEWKEEIDSVFGAFRDAGVGDVIMDLRYNPGGYDYVSAYLASTLAPAAVSENKEVFVNIVWNDLYMEYWREADLDNDGEPDGDESRELVMRLPESDVNMDLSRVYFLTTDGSASASEALIVGLLPYMDVVQIGTPTEGKFYGGWLIGDTENPGRHNWAMVPLVLKYANSEGLSDFVNGLIPTIEVIENPGNLKPFGSFEDPILAAALEDITGVAPVQKASTAEPGEFRKLSVPEQFTAEHGRFPGGMIRTAPGGIPEF